MKAMLLILFFTFSTSLMAADKNGRYSIFDITCSEWSKKRETNKDIELKYWVYGYFTAYNQLQNETYDILGPSKIIGIHAWLDAWCKKHPLGHVANGMQYLSYQLWPNRVINEIDNTR